MWSSRGYFRWGLTCRGPVIWHGMGIIPGPAHKTDWCPEAKRITDAGKNRENAGKISAATVPIPGAPGTEFSHNGWHANHIVQLPCPLPKRSRSYPVGWSLPGEIVCKD